MPYLGLRQSLSSKKSILETDRSSSRSRRASPPDVDLGGFEQIALDGKTLRGARGDNLPAVPLLTAYACESGITVAQLRVHSKTNKHKAALEFLGVLPLKSKVVAADAMFAHRDFCEKVRGRDGHDVLPVKENQPTLERDVKTAFDDPPPGGARFAPRLSLQTHRL